MSGMDEKRDERVGKGESGVRITPAETSYMRDWRLTWRPVCDNRVVIEQGSAKTKFYSGEHDFGQKFPTAKEPRRIDLPHGHPSRHDSCGTTVGVLRYRLSIWCRLRRTVHELAFFCYLHFQVYGINVCFAIEKGLRIMISASQIYERLVRKQPHSIAPATSGLS